MKIIRKVEFKPGSYEEELPGISAEFPYIASYVELDKCAGRQSPWHWHKEAELFYMEQGSLEYDTPHGKTVFTAGSGGFVIQMCCICPGQRRGKVQSPHFFISLTRC